MPCVFYACALLQLRKTPNNDVLVATTLFITRAHDTAAVQLRSDGLQHLGESSDPSTPRFSTGSIANLVRLPTEGQRQAISYPPATPLRLFRRRFLGGTGVIRIDIEPPNV